MERLGHRTARGNTTDRPTVGHRLEDDPTTNRYVRGAVTTTSNDTRFLICTLTNPTCTLTYPAVGMVVRGLAQLRAAIWKYEATQITIVDCGVELTTGSA